MYENTNVVIENIKQHFETKFGEAFEMNDENGRFVNYQSENYNFDVAAAFIQCTGELDFSVSIQDRIDGVLASANIEKGKHYNFSSRYTANAPTIEYCVTLS